MNYEYLDINGVKIPLPLSVFRVGTVISTDSNESPASYLGGVWEKIEGRVLLGASSTYPVGSTGGAATVTLTTDQMPYHTHQEMLSNGNWNYNAVYNQGGAVSTYEGAAIAGLTVSAKGGYAYVGYTGGGQAHNNMMPYYATNHWRRVA